jgi:predicted regulator of Ras-like GTPase activity (Roadblock/LC7/MglB family)
MKHSNEKLNRLLSGLYDRSSDIEACALISENGRIIASSLPPEFEDSRIAATSAVIVSMATRTIEDFRRGDMEYVIVKGRDGYAIILDAGPNCVLLTLLRKEVKLGLLFFYLTQVSEQVKSVLS